MSGLTGGILFLLALASPGIVALGYTIYFVVHSVRKGQKNFKYLGKHLIIIGSIYIPVVILFFIYDIAWCYFYRCTINIPAVTIMGSALVLPIFAFIFVAGLLLWITGKIRQKNPTAIKIDKTGD